MADIRSITAVICCLLAASSLVACGSNDSHEQPGSVLAQQQTEHSVTAAQSARDALFDVKTRFEIPAAIEVLAEIVASNPTDSASRLVLAYAFLKRSRYEDAQRQVEAIDSENLDERHRLWLDAINAVIEDKPIETANAWGLVVESFPKDRWAWYERASALAGLERYAEAADATVAALELEPNPKRWEASWIYYLHSKSLFRSGQYDNAIEAARAGRSLATTWRSTYYRMALAQVMAGHESSERFVAEYRDISAAEDRNNESYTEANIALFFYELRDFDLAVEHGRLAYELEPKSYQSWAYAYSLTEAGQPEAALEILEAAAEAFPEDAHISAARSWSLFRLGRLDESRKALEVAQAKAARHNFYFGQVLDIIESAQRNAIVVSEAVNPWLG